MHQAIKVISEGGEFRGTRLYDANGAHVPVIGKAIEDEWRRIEKVMDEKYQEIMARKAKG
jgi:hypothetical protein